MVIKITPVVPVRSKEEPLQLPLNEMRDMDDLAVGIVGSETEPLRDDVRYSVCRKYPYKSGIYTAPGSPRGCPVDCNDYLEDFG